MKKKSLKTRILNYIRKQEGWVNGGTIEELAMKASYKASNASRRCRELENGGLIQREKRKGKRTSSVWYRASSPKTIYSVEGIGIIKKGY